MDRRFGSVAGIEVGDEFKDRRALYDVGAHRTTQAGICYSAAEGAESVVVSGGYEDDEGYGDLIIYTGHGGNDPATGKQIADQELTRGNLALGRNADEGIPVRVIRGAGGDPTYSPATGLRYDGLFWVDAYWSEPGRSGFRVWRYRLVQSTEGPQPEHRPPALADEERAPPERVEATIQRIVRSTQVANHVKQLHGHRCQVCGETVRTPTGPYAESAHIRPLGRPHDGPDAPGNVLCLCPNDHVRFDRGAIQIHDDFTITYTETGAVEGTLITVDGHRVDVAMLRYHRSLWA